MNLINSGVPDAGNTPALVALDAPYAVIPFAAAGAIGVTQGFCPITAGSAIALTLAAPVAGLPSAGGNDGQCLVLFDTSGHAHTVTTPSNILNGNKHIATWGGTAASFLELYAYQGVWYVAANSGITLS